MAIAYLSTVLSAKPTSAKAASLYKSPEQLHFYIPLYGNRFSDCQSKGPPCNWIPNISSLSHRRICSIVYLSLQFPYVDNLLWVLNENRLLVLLLIIHCYVFAPPEDVKCFYVYHVFYHAWVFIFPLICHNGQVHDLRKFFVSLLYFLSGLKLNLCSNLLHSYHNLHFTSKVIINQPLFIKILSE